MNTEVRSRKRGEIAACRILFGIRSTGGSRSDDPNGREGSGSFARRGPTGRDVLDGHGWFRTFERTHTPPSWIANAAARVLCDGCSFAFRTAIPWVRGGVDPDLFRRGDEGRTWRSRPPPMRSVSMDAPFRPVHVEDDDAHPRRARNARSSSRPAVREVRRVDGRRHGSWIVSEGPIRVRVRPSIGSHLLPLRPWASLDSFHSSHVRWEGVSWSARSGPTQFPWR